MLRDGFGHVVYGIGFSEQAQEVDKYYNRRVEIYARMRNWIIDRPVRIPDDQKIYAELCSIRFKKNDARGRLLLESKDDVKARLGKSPDIADAIALTFSEELHEINLYDRANIFKQLREISPVYDW